MFFIGAVPVHDKGPLKNYVILLGGGGEVTKRLHKITRGEGGYTKRLHWITGGGSNWFNLSIDYESRKTQNFTRENPFFWS